MCLIIFFLSTYYLTVLIVLRHYDHSFLFFVLAVLLYRYCLFFGGVTTWRIHLFYIHRTQRFPLGLFFNCRLIMYSEAKKHDGANESRAIR